jgi:rSAM/selenodomain-associated transferase 1
VGTDLNIAACALVVFAKAPVAGQVKTRLIPALGALGAAQLAQRLLQHAVGQSVAAGLGSVELCVSPDVSHPSFLALASRHGLALTEQGSGDLGQRMHRALARRLATDPGVLLIGTDAPALDAAVLREAARALQTHDAVFVPALDGGYALVGLRRQAPELFANIAWSTPQVMAATRHRAQAAGLRWAELPALGDVDVPDDLVHLKHLQPLPDLPDLPGD